jgi:hypothetical protein
MAAARVFGPGSTPVSVAAEAAGVKKSKVGKEIKRRPFARPNTLLQAYDPFEVTWARRGWLCVSLKKSDARRSALLRWHF